MPVCLDWGTRARSYELRPREILEIASIDGVAHGLLKVHERRGTLAGTTTQEKEMKLTTVTLLLVALSVGACSKAESEKRTEAVPADNTKKNERDQAGTLLPTDQSETAADRDITAKVRQDVVADENLGMKAKNVKIITRDGHVTLRGVVEKPAERELVASHAMHAAGVRGVDNQLEIAN